MHTNKINLCKKFQKSVKLPSCKRSFLNVNKKGVYFVWVGLEKSKTKNLGTADLAKYVALFCHEWNYIV